MSKVALYFKRWKNYSRHKKLSEEWAFATKLKDFNEVEEEKCDNDLTDIDIFEVKFIGSTLIDEPRSETVTANAIKHMISKTKSSNKKLQRINISVCPNGIETFDIVTGETMHRISIYKISYCSADAAHSNVFAFIAGTGDDTFESENETLKCYAYICPNRKIARKLTLTVAKSFQRAYELWSKSEQRRRSVAESTVKLQTAVASEKRRQSESNTITDRDVKKSQQRNLLIDFNDECSSGSVSPEPPTNFFQNTWIAFDDSPANSQC